MREGTDFLNRREGTERIDAVQDGGGQEATPMSDLAFSPAKEEAERDERPHFRDLIDEHWTDVHRFAVAKIGNRNF